jgi:hypothetical protein
MRCVHFGPGIFSRQATLVLFRSESPCPVRAQSANYSSIPLQRPETNGTLHVAEYAEFDPIVVCAPALSAAAALPVPAIFFPGRAAADVLLVVRSGPNGNQTDWLHGEVACIRVPDQSLIITAPTQIESLWSLGEQAREVSARLTGFG